MHQQLQQFLEQKPFQPFQVTLRDGRVFEIRRRDFALLLNRRLRIGIAATAAGDIPDRAGECSIDEILRIDRCETIASPSSGAPPRIALIGCGLVGQKRLNLLPPGSVTVTCDLQLARAQKLAAQAPGCLATDSVETAVSSPEVDAVMIATVNASLAPLALQAVQRGKHVLIEKPGAIRVRELDALEAAATKTGALVRVGYNHRYHPACLKALEIFQSGALGPMMFVRGRYGQGGRIGYDREWRADPKLSGGGELIDQGVHLIDLARLFLGDFASVDGHATTCFWDMPVDDNAFLSLRTAHGQTAWLHASCSEWKNLFSLEIYGRLGKLHWEGLGGSYGLERLIYYKMLPEMGPPETTIWEFPRGDESWKIEMQEFFEDIRLKRTPQPGLNEAKAVLQVVERIYARGKDS
jgi:predicted dehydrogenase